MGNFGSIRCISTQPRSADNAPETGPYGRDSLGAGNNRPFSATTLVERLCHYLPPAKAAKMVFRIRRANSKVFWFQDRRVIV